MEPMLLMSDTTATSDDNNVEDDDHIHDTVCRGAGHCRPCVSINLFHPSFKTYVNEI